MKDLVQYLKEQIENLPLIYNVSKYHTKSTQLGQFFGAAWEYIDPIFQLLIYYFVFIVMFKRKVAGMPPAPWMFIGLGIWFFYSISITHASAAVQSSLALFSQVKFPISVLPTIEMFKRFNALFWMIGLGIIIALKDGYYPTLYYFQLIYYFAALILLVLGFSLLFSTIVVVFRDFSHIIDYIFRFLLYVSMVTFCKVFFANKVHRKPGNLSAKSCKCMISAHRKACYWSRSDSSLFAKYCLSFTVRITASNDLTYKSFATIRQVL